MKSIHSLYSTQFNYYYLYLLELFITNQKPKNQTNNVLAKSLLIRHLLILLRISTLLGNGCCEIVISGMCDS